MYAIRRWSVRHAAFMEGLYAGFSRMLLCLGPLSRRIGHQRLEVPVAAVERRVKGFLFDCRMCGQCELSSTGMACPMNCPKELRNGPCGGVRPDGGCEVIPAMRCVWVEAWEGSRAMRQGNAIADLGALPLDNRLRGRSSWLREVREAEKSIGQGPELEAG